MSILHARSTCWSSSKWHTRWQSLCHSERHSASVLSNKYTIKTNYGVINGISLYCDPFSISHCVINGKHLYKAVLWQFVVFYLVTEHFQSANKSSKSPTMFTWLFIIFLLFMNESSLRDKTLYIKVWKRLLSKWLFFMWNVVKRVCGR